MVRFIHICVMARRELCQLRDYEIRELVRAGKVGRVRSCEVPRRLSQRGHEGAAPDRQNGVRGGGFSTVALAYVQCHKAEESVCVLGDVADVSH